jgi:hypothetical protein
MGSRQRPSGHITSETGGRQSRAGESAEQQDAAAAEQSRGDGEALAAAREDAEGALPSEEPVSEENTAR